MTTPALAERYATHGRYAILPNYIPKAYLDLPRPTNSPLRVGWTGSTRTHVRDLEVTGGGVARALQGTGAEFHVVGVPNDVRRQLDLAREPVSTGWVHLDQYPAELAKFDVLVAPLQDNTFNRGKSLIKGLEAAAAGVVPVMSPAADYLRLHDDYGIGLIARTPDEWFDRVRTLLTDHDLRR